MTAINHAPPEQTAVPLAMLCVAETNVRQNQTSAGLAGLKASILARGVVSPLSVIAPPKGARGAKAKYQVIAGGRRFQALRELANELKIGEQYQVPVVVRAESDAADTVEISLIENVMREPLKPHEEYAAFARLSDAGAGEAAIAEHFGVTVRRVGQMLRLGKLHPPIVEAFVAGKIGEAEAQKFAATADRDLQAKAWEAYQAIPSYSRYLHQIAGLIAGKNSHELQTQLMAVGRERYAEAGGRLEVDLFDDEDRARILDPDILARLFEERRAEAFAKLRADLPGVELVEMPIAYNVGAYVTAEPEPLDPDTVAAVAAMEAEIEPLRAQLDGLCNDDGDLIDEEDADKAFAIEAEIDAIEDRIDAAKDGAQRWSFPEVEGKLIAHPRLDARSGQFIVDIRSVRHVPAAWSEDNQVSFEPTPAAHGSSAGGSTYVSPEAAAKRDHGLNKDGIEVMRGHRQQILQAAMMHGAAWSGDFLTFAIVRAIDGPGQEGSNGIAGHVVTDQNMCDHGELIAQPGRALFSRVHERLDRGWVDIDDAAEGYRQFVELSGAEKYQWMRYAAGLILSRSMNADGFRAPVHDAIATQIGLTDAAIRTYWTPDAAYWARIPKKHRLAALNALDPAIGRASAKLDNDGLAARCAAIFGDGDQALLTKLVPPKRAWKLAEQAKAWVPPYLSFGVGVEAADDGGSDEDAGSDGDGVQEETQSAGAEAA